MEQQSERARAFCRLTPHRDAAHVGFGVQTAFAYVRVSSSGQLDGHGLERQEDAIRRFARARRFRVVEVFTDAHTGTDAERPGFAAMVAALRANGTKVVLVESMDRVARSLSVQMALVGALEREGAALFSAATGQDVVADMRDDPMREAMVLMQGVFAQADKKLLTRKLRQARDAKRARGERCEGVRPYGEIPGEGAVLAVIRSMRRGRHGFAAIAAALNAAGHRTRGRRDRPARAWTAADVRHLCRR
jgi:DNA invertase Pin-like site-specific DNA recombinase